MILIYWKPYSSIYWKVETFQLVTNIFITLKLLCYTFWSMSQPQLLTYYYLLTRPHHNHKGNKIEGQFTCKDVTVSRMEYDGLTPSPSPKSRQFTRHKSS
jgi:hypothetical protein